MSEKRLTEQERAIVEKLGDTLYTPDFLQVWINRKDNVMINAPAALQAMGAHGFYQAVRRIAEKGGF